MPDDTQDNLLFRVITPLGKDKLLFKSLQGEEQLSGLFHFHIEMLSSSKTLDFNSIVGQNLTVKLEYAPNHERFFNGMVTRFVQGGTFFEPNSTASLTVYHAEIRPWLWQLTLTKNCRIFQHLSIPQIIQKVFDDLGFSDYRFALIWSYPPRIYCVQYEETAFEFVSRLMEDEGFFYFFEHTEDKHILVIADDRSVHQPCPGIDTARYQEASNLTQPENAITTCQYLQQMTTGQYAIDDFNFETPSHDLFVPVNGGKGSSMRVYEYKAGFKTIGEGEAKSNRRIESHITDYQLLKGQSHCFSFTSGYQFTLKDHPRQELDDKYVLRWVSHSVSYNSYSNAFLAHPAKAPFRAPIVTPKPKIVSPQTAIVTGPKGEEIHTDEYGRIKVQFHWDQEGQYDENSSCWIRVNQGWAGKGWGNLFHPRIGQEVIVSFLNGNPDEPLVTGSVYNAQQRPPYSLPAEQTKSTIKSNSSKGGQGFNEIRFEDKKGEEQIFVHGQNRMDVRIRSSLYETIGDSHEVRIGWENEGEKGGNDNLLVKENQNIKIEGGRYESIDKTFNQIIKENIVHDWQNNVTTLVGHKAELNAEEIIMEASKQISLKVGDNFVVINTGGVTIQGKPFINLNSPGVPPATGVEQKEITDPQEASPADNGKTGERSNLVKNNQKPDNKTRILEPQRAPSQESEAPKAETPQSIENLKQLTEDIKTAHPDWNQGEIVSQLRRSIPEYSRGIWSVAMPFNRGSSTLEDTFQQEFLNIREQMLNEEGIDLGHVFASMDVAQSFDIIDDTHASWAGDLGSAVIESFYRKEPLEIGDIASKASLPDLLGDIDGDNIARHMLKGQELDTFFDYYQGASAVNISNRYETFAKDLELLDNIGNLKPDAVNTIESHTRNFIYLNNAKTNVKNPSHFIESFVSGQVQSISDTNIPTLTQEASKQFLEIIENGLQEKK